MILTFAFFVGLAVLMVAFYVLFVLRGQAEDVFERAQHEQSARLAAVLERAGTDAERVRLLEAASAGVDLRFTLLSPQGYQTQVADGQHTRSVLDAGMAPPFEAALDVQRARNGAGHLVYYTEERLSTGELLRVGQPEPALYGLVERMLVTMLVGMLMALFMAMLGAWVAAQQVTRPLQQIRDSARTILDGDYTQKIALESRSAEFQSVALHLNRMSDSFRTKIGELERLAHMQGEFIGNVSHEVRNPIFAVGGYLEALASPTLPPEQRTRYSEKALAALSRLQNLFNDLIEIARLEYREDLIRASIFDMQGVLEEAEEMLRAKAEEKGLELELQNPSIYVYADRNRIRQVMVNLIENAIAYTDEGTVRCRIRQRLDKVRVEVVDTGRGIPDDSRDRIFERFYRVDPDRSRKSGGTGLGLSIVHQIIQAHGEQIHVESTLGRGSRFYFDLPHAEKTATPEPRPASA